MNDLPEDIRMIRLTDGSAARAPEEIEAIHAAVVFLTGLFSTLPPTVMGPVLSSLVVSVMMNFTDDPKEVAGDFARRLPTLIEVALVQKAAVESEGA